MQEPVHFQVSPLPGLFGAQVDGLDLARETTPAVVETLVRLLHENSVLVIHDQSLTSDQYVAFGCSWGRPVPFLKKNMFSKQGQSDAAPEIMRVSNDINTAPQHRYNALNWHVDLSYEAEPCSVTMLLGIETPREGGETLFANAALAYEALPAARKEQIAYLTALHRPRGAPLIEGEIMPRGRATRRPFRTR